MLVEKEQRQQLRAVGTEPIKATNYVFLPLIANKKCQLKNQDGIFNLLRFLPNILLLWSIKKRCF